MKLKCFYGPPFKHTELDRKIDWASDIYIVNHPSTKMDNWQNVEGIWLARKAQNFVN
jgi:hypothetical protein